MEQTAGPSQIAQNPGFWQKNRNFLLVAGLVIVVAAIAYFATRGDEPKETITTGEENTEQTQENSQAGGETQNKTDAEAPSTPGASAGEVSGNFSATGTLRESDDPARGNLMIEGEGPKIYIATVRDFSVMLGQKVTLSGEGTLASFAFLGFQNENGTGGPAPEPETPVAEVKATGELQNSDNIDLGNYQILTENTKVYLKSVRDYSALVGSQVVLAAKGTIESFYDANLTKK